MSLIKNLLDYLYPVEDPTIRDSINTELDECQSILISHGFKVKRSANLIHDESVQSLIAEKGHVVLTASPSRKVRKSSLH